MPWAGPAYLVGDTTSKQNLRSTSSQGFTEQSRRSSTTTVSTSCRHDHHGPCAQHPALPHPDHLFTTVSPPSFSSPGFPFKAQLLRLLFRH